MGKFNKMQIIIDKTFIAAFAILAGGAAFAVVFRGAWWHAWTIVMGAAMCLVLHKEAKREKIKKRGL